MKIVFAVVLALMFATPVLAAPTAPDENGCGMGAFYLVRSGAQQLRHQPPRFIHFDNPTLGNPDNGEVREGRYDTFYMVRLQQCVDEKQS